MIGKNVIILEVVKKNFKKINSVNRRDNLFLCIIGFFRYVLTKYCITRLIVNEKKIKKKTRIYKLQIFQDPFDISIYIKSRNHGSALFCFLYIYFRFSNTTKERQTI